MESTMIEVRDLVKTYGPTRALKGITFSVPRGQIVGFLGPNGAGKTTTMKIVTGYLRPTSGDAEIQGRPVSADSMFTRSKIGYLPENAPLYEEMMVLEFLEFIAFLRAVPKSEQRARISAMVDACGLGDVLGKDISQLSKGFRQRVGLAQAMIHDPEILILDEPTSGLDPNQIVEIRDLIRDLGREKTVVLSTHILPEVQATCDRAVIINDGQLVADDTLEGLTTGDGSRVRLIVGTRTGESPDHALLSEVFGQPEAVENVLVSEDENRSAAVTVITASHADPRRDIFDVAVANDLVLLEMRRETVSLEETFRRLTAKTGGGHA